MIAFNCLLIFGLGVHLVSSDVSLTIGSNRPNVKTEESVRSNYEAPRGYEYSGSFSTVAPDRNAQYSNSLGNAGQYVGSHSTAAPEIKYIGSSYSSGVSENNAQYVNSYSTAAPDNKAQYVGSYSTAALDNKAQYRGSYSTAAPDNKAQYVGSYSTAATDNKAQHVGSYSSAAPDNNAQYVGSYSTEAPDNKAQYRGYYSTVAPDNKVQYVSSYSTAAPDYKAQYRGSYSTEAPDNKAKYVGTYTVAAPDSRAQTVGSYSTPTPDNKARYVGSYSTVAPDSKAEYVSSYSTAAPDDKAQYSRSYSAVAPENKAQYVGSYSTAAPDNKAQYFGSYSKVAPENKAQYSSSSSSSSYDSYPSGQVASDRGYYSAKQEYHPQYQNDRGVLLISKELQVPFLSSKETEKTEECDETKHRNLNQVQSSDQDSVQGSVQSSVQIDSKEYDRNYENQNDGNVEQNVPAAPVYKTSKYEVRRPGIRKEFYDIEEKVFIKPAGTAIFELQHDKPHSLALVNKHFSQQQSSPLYPEYPQYSEEDSQNYPEEQQYANHGYGPVFIPPPQTPVYHYPPVAQPPTLPPNTYKPVYPSTTITPGYIPPVEGGFLPPCEDVPSVPSKPSKPHAHHELSDEYDENDHHDYDADAGYITPVNEESQDIKYATSKSSSNQEREYYRVPQPSGFNHDSRIDRLRVEYQNQRGDLAQLKANQYPQQFYHEYVPNVNVDQVQIRPNGDAPAKYSQEKVSSQVEIENSQRLLDLYSANGDVTEVGFGRDTIAQQYKVPKGNVPARVVSVTPAPEYANYVDEQTKSRRVALTQPLYTVQQVEVREHNHRLVEDVQHDGVAPSVNAFEKLQLIGGSFGKSSSSRSADVNRDVEYLTPVPQEYGRLRAASPVPENLQK